MRRGPERGGRGVALGPIGGPPCVPLRLLGRGHPAHIHAVEVPVAVPDMRVAAAIGLGDVEVLEVGVVAPGDREMDVGFVGIPVAVI